MNKKVLVFVLLAITVIAGGFIFVLGNSTGNQTKQSVSDSQNKASNEPDDSSSQNRTTAKASVGSYVNYSENVIASTEGTRLLFFHAPWCPQCRALDADIKQSDIPSGVTIIKVDYDTNQQLRQKYGVTIQTTVVRIDADGNLVEKYVAYDEPTLANVASNLL